MAERDLQDEVERILRRLTLEDLKAVATHLAIADMDAAENTRVVLRSVQDQFDNEADAEARNALLRGLPIPEPHTANYERLFAPAPERDQVVPVVPGNDVAPVNGGLDGGHGQAVGQNGGAPDGGDNHVGQQGGGPPVGGLGGIIGAQAVNNGVNNDGFAQQNMAQNFGGFQNQNVAGLGGVQRPQVGGFQQQNP